MRKIWKVKKIFVVKIDNLTLEHLSGEKRGQALDFGVFKDKVYLELFWGSFFGCLRIVFYNLSWGDIL